MVANITRKMVLSTLREFDKVGGKRFLRDSGFRDSTGYDLVHGGKQYPPKAIFGVAQKLSSRDTHGGTPVNEPLRRLGFAIIEKGEFAGFDDAELERLPSRDKDYTTRTSIRIRRGQNKHRNALLRIYENKCAVTGQYGAAAAGCGPHQSVRRRRRIRDVQWDHFAYRYSHAIRRRPTGDFP